MAGMIMMMAETGSIAYSVIWSSAGLRYCSWAQRFYFIRGEWKGKV